MELMKLEVVVEVYAEMMLKWKIMLLLLLLEIKGAVIGVGNAASIFIPEQYNPWNNSTNKSQAPEDGCINTRNMLRIK